MYQKASSALKISPFYNMFIASFSCFCIIGVLTMLYVNDLFSKGVFDALGMTFSIIFFFYSPFYSM